MATAPEQIQLSSELQQELAQLADHAGKPWETVLTEALANYRASRLPNIAGESVTEAMMRLGLLGCVKDAPADLSTNPNYMHGYGRDNG